MKFFFMLVVLNFALLSNATRADPSALQPAQPETRYPETQSSSAQRSKTATPPDSSPFESDSPEKQKRIKKLLDQIEATYGVRFGREYAPSWGPRLGKLYSLHKKLADRDWALLAEMYVTFRKSDMKLIVSIPFDKDFRDKGRIGEAMSVLLAMRGKESLEALSKMFSNPNGNSDLWQGDVDIVKNTIEFKPWSSLPEYKKDQEAACKSNEMTACTTLGYLYEREGFRKKSSYLKAKEFYEKACIAGEVLACVGLGRLYDGGNGIEQDSLKAKDLYEKACSTDGAACGAVGDSYKNGLAVKPDYFKAMEYYEIACNTHHAKSCNSLGDFYFQGWEVAQSYSKAKEYYKKACDLGYQNGCDEYTRLNDQQKNALKHE
ncbi:MAG: sel1 repeat family protein [Proteobacteria bacterium]|nr:sel1 repeat family protein [Pseudomonadota bacterium]